MRLVQSVLHTILLDGVPWRHFNIEQPLSRGQKLLVMREFAKREGAALGGLEITHTGWIIVTRQDGTQERRARN